ncbi:unnamed protein product [Adineta steineri]|uniref:VPS9 domain-containing protein n=1 Tax=Adineta steineri TaxID=433720 RepID=A0A813NX50_9BILA|nr:unnamed protein product [Adineta steineri]CAF0750102.1 unnamed protein product [Adineta steineri]
MDEKRIQKLLKEAERIRHANSRNPKDKIDIYHETAEACRSVGKYDEAIKYFTYALHEAQLLDLREDILYCHRFLGECYFAKNQFHTSEKHHLNFLSSAQEYADDERTEQAYTCLTHTYWVWLSYLQDDVLHNVEYDQLPREICKKSLDAAKNSLLMIEKLDYQLNIDMKKKSNIKIKDLEKKQQDLALKRVRAYINVANAMSEKYTTGDKSGASLKALSQYIKSAIELAKKHQLHEELARLHSSVSTFYLSVPNFLQYKKEIIGTMEQAIRYAQLAKNISEYLSCLHDTAQALLLFDDYQGAKTYLLKIYRYRKNEPIKEKATRDLVDVQRILTGIEDRYERENDLRKKMKLAEKCADTFSHLKRNEKSKNYYLKQLKHAQELNLDECEMAVIYSSLGSICQDLQEWQTSIDYFRREMSCRVGLGSRADVEQGYSLCEIIKCEYRLNIDIDIRITTFKRVLTIARSTNDRSLIRMAVALVFAMKLRDPTIYLDEDLEEFISNIQPPITKENYSEILRRSERTNSEITDSSQSNDDDDDDEDENNGNESDDDDAILATISDESEDDDNEDDDELDSTIRGKGRQRKKISRNCYGESRLHLACKEKSGLRKVKQFISEGDDINLQDNHGWTPLHEAVNHGHIDIVRCVLDSKANINIKANNGITALIDACNSGQLDIIEALLSYGAKTNIRTNNGYTAVDYLTLYDENMSPDDRKKFNRLKELLLASMRKDEPTYCTQRVIRSDFGNESDEEEATLTMEHNSNSNDSVDDVLEKTTDKRLQYKNIMNNIRRGIQTDEDGTNNKRSPLKKKKSKLTPFVSDAEYERTNANEKHWVVDDREPIEIGNPSSSTKSRKQRLQRSRSPSASSSHTPASKRRRTITDAKSPLKTPQTISHLPPPPPPPPLLPASNDIDIINFDDLDLFSPLKKESPAPSNHTPSLSPVLQVMTPKSITRSRRPSSTSSINTITTTTTTTTSLPPPSISHDTTTRIIRCLANTNQRTNEDKKLRIPMSPTDTLSSLRYQVLKRLYDNFNIYACSIKATYIEKDPIVVYEQLCKANKIAAYSNIRSALKLFFDKFELSLQRLSLRLEQTICILQVFENFMFIYSINLSENNLTDGIFDQLGKLSLDQLKSLNLSQNKFTSNGIRKLFEQKTMNNLLLLDLTGNIDIDCVTLTFIRSRHPNITVYH